MIPFFVETTPYEHGFSVFHAQHLMPLLEELEVKRQRWSKRVRSLWMGSTTVLVLGILFLYWLIGNGEPTRLFQLFVAVTPLLFLAIWMETRSSRKLYRLEYKSQILPVFLSFFGAEQYQMQAVPEDLASWNLLPPHDEVRGGDFFKGHWKKLAYQVQEFQLYKHLRHSKICIFKGLLLRVSFSRVFHGKTLVLKDQGDPVFNWVQGFSTDLQKVHLEDPDFEKRFEIYSTDQEEARYLLNPAVMERLIQLSQRHYENTILKPSLRCLFLNQELIIALSTQRNILEPGPLEQSLLDPDIFRPPLKETSELLSVIEKLTPASLNSNHF